MRSTRGFSPAEWETFGQQGGLEVENKETILLRVDQILNCDSVLEFFFVEPCRPLAFDSLLEKFTQYSYCWGHAAIRYKLTVDGKRQDYVVNLANPNSGFADFVSFVSPSEYLFSTSEKAFKASEQYGIYGRSYQIMRIEEGGVPESQIQNMHQYFLDLQKRSDEKKVVWASTPFHCYMNQVQRFFGQVTEEGGGCADWISRGLTAGGFISRPKRFPKAIWASLVKNYLPLKKQGKMHFVSIRRAIDAKLHVSYNGFSVDDEDKSLHSHKGPVSWLQWFSTVPHWNLERYADVVVSCKPGGNVVSVEKKKAEPYIHEEGGLLSSLVRYEVEPFLVGGTLCAIWDTSVLLYLALIGVVFLLAKTKGHWLSFDAVTAQITLLVSLVPISILTWFFEATPLVKFVKYATAILVWYRLFYYWAS